MVQSLNNYYEISYYTTCINILVNQDKSWKECDPDEMDRPTRYMTTCVKRLQHQRNKLFCDILTSEFLTFGHVYSSVVGNVGI
jgi:hypothetical protein